MSADKTYRAFEKAFRDVQAWIVAKDGKEIARIAVKTTGRSSSAGLTVRAYVHVLGCPMVRGSARGGGYDMTTAAIANACIKLKPQDCKGELHSLDATLFKSLEDEGWDIPKQLRDMGYSVFQAV